MTENHSANGGRLLVDCLIAQGCDRILVMREGRMAGLLSRAEASEEEIVRLASPRGSAVTPQGEALAWDRQVPA